MAHQIDRSTKHVLRLLSIKVLKYHGYFFASFDKRQSCHVAVWLSTAGHTSQQSQHFVFVRLAGTQSPRKHFVKIKLFVLCEYLVQCWIAFTSQININIPSTSPTKIFINLQQNGFRLAACLFQSKWNSKIIIIPIKVPVIT